jgi:solute carrier family 25 (mitochondrial carnitine/acylcarnitine transporter), member 20/29
MGQLFFRSAMFWVNGAYLRWASGNGKRGLSYLEYAIGGSITWASCTLIECPLQLSSSQLQVQIVKQKSNPSYVPEFRGIIDYVRIAPKKYGVRAFYTGIAPQLCRNAAGGFFHFGAFEYLRREYAKQKGVPVTQVGIVVNMAAGSVGGILFWALTYPFDVVSTYLIVFTHLVLMRSPQVKSAIQGDALDPRHPDRRFRGSLDAVRQLWAEGGAARFTRGFSACLLRSVPANAVLLTTAMTIKEIGYARLGVIPK